mgnify:CR=1 FL=1
MTRLYYGYELEKVSARSKHGYWRIRAPNDLFSRGEVLDHRLTLNAAKRFVRKHMEGNK